MNLDRILGPMFGLIALFLILSRGREFNSIINSIGTFVTQQTRTLQGVATSPTARILR